MDSTQLNSYAKEVDNGVKAVQEIKQLQGAGYVYDNIFVLAHDEDRTDRIADTANATEIGIKEEGVSLLGVRRNDSEYWINNDSYVFLDA